MRRPRTKSWRRRTSCATPTRRLRTTSLTPRRPNSRRARTLPTSSSLLSEDDVGRVRARLLFGRLGVSEVVRSLLVGVAQLVLRRQLFVRGLLIDSHAVPLVSHLVTR